MSDFDSRLMQIQDFLDQALVKAQESMTLDILRLHPESDAKHRRLTEALYLYAGENGSLLDVKTAFKDWMLSIRVL